MMHHRHPRRTSFLDLPLEVRLQIYGLALTPSKLCTRAVLDPEWLFSRVPNGKTVTVAPLIFASRQVYREAAPLFYARATLEVTPCQFDPADGRRRAEFAEQYERDHAFCPREFLGAVRNVHVYCDQGWPVDQDAFQALFRWLIAKTAVECIYLSRKTMQQGRHVPELISLDDLAYDVRTQPQEMRIIDVYARNVSSRLRFSNCAGTTRAKPLPGVQLYRDSPFGARPQLCREPQWGLLSVDEGVAVDEEDLLKQQMERFASGPLGDAYLRREHSDGYLWLFKTIQIQRRVGLGLPTRRLDFNDTRLPILAF